MTPAKAHNKKPSPKKTGRLYSLEPKYLRQAIEMQFHMSVGEHGEAFEHHLAQHVALGVKV